MTAKKIILILIIALFPLFSFADLTKSGIIEYTNQVRSYYGISSLKSTKTLNQAAQARANTIKELKHDGWLKYQGNYDWFGENLGNYWTDDLSFMIALINSPTHFDNIINPNYDEIGVGIKWPFVVVLYGNRW